MFECVAVCCGVLQCVDVCFNDVNNGRSSCPVCCSVLQCVANMLQCGVVCCSAMKCVAVCIAVCCRVI